MELTEQPIPEETRCPNCGEKPSDESVVEHRLAASGYLHDDIRLECGECESRWTCGTPIGEEMDYGDDLYCDACEDSVMLVHRVRVLGERNVELHLKCPNCYYFDKTRRETDEGGLTLCGYPNITGSFEGADPFGYKSEN